MNGYSDSNWPTSTSTTGTFDLFPVVIYDSTGTLIETTAGTTGNVILCEETHECNNPDLAELRQAAFYAPWELEDRSSRMRLGSAREGVRRRPPLNRPMRRQRRPPSWMRRKRA